jgi:hypothetical protein
MKKDKILIAILAVAGVATFSACDTARQREAQTIEKNQNALLVAYPVPRFDTSLERDILVQLYGLRNQARNTYTVLMSDGTGRPFYDCPTVGYPIANDVRLTASTSGSEQQAEPNGVYPAASSWGTWVMCVNDDGSLNPIYNEQDTITFPFPVTVDYLTGKVTKTGDATMVINLTDPVTP